MMSELVEEKGAEVIALSLPTHMPFTEWVGMGKGLLGQRRLVDWLIADWWKHGHKSYAEEPQFQFMVEQLAVDPKRLNAAAKVAEAFPEHMRAANLSFEVHRELASIAPDDRLPMIQRAAREKWTEKRAHSAVVEYRHEQGTLLPDDDPETRMAVEIIRAWNRAPENARRYFFDLARRVSFGPIDEEKVQDV
jgi:hypothetical protein